MAVDPRVLAAVLQQAQLAHQGGPAPGMQPPPGGPMSGAPSPGMAPAPSGGPPPMPMAPPPPQAMPAPMPMPMGGQHIRRPHMGHKK